MLHVVFELADGATRRIPANPGESVMRAATRADIPGIIAECGGALTCATCHVYVSPAWLDRLPAPEHAEAEMLEMLDDLQPGSRLSCQITVEGDLDGLAVIVPQPAG